MNNWIIKLMMMMGLTVASNILITGVCLLLGFQFWGLIASVAASMVISVIVIVAIYDFAGNSFSIPFLVLTLTGISFIGNQWLYYSSDETIHLANIKELLAMPEKPIYFTLDDYKYDLYKEGTVQKKKRTKVGKHYRTIPYSHLPTYLYTAIPMYADSLQEEAKVWIVFQQERKNGHILISEPDRKHLLNFELLLTDTGDYREAMEASDHPHKAARPLFITPVYEPYITKTRWRLYFFLSLALELLSIVIIGTITNRQQRRKKLFQ